LRLLKNRKEEPLFTFPFLLVGFVSLMINGINTVQLTILPLYTLSLGGDNMTAGVVTAGFTVTALLFKNLSGRTVGKHGLRWPLIIGYSFCFIISLLTGILPYLAVIVLLRILFGAGLTFTSTSIGKAAADNIAPSRLMEGMGYIGLVSGLAMSVGNAAAVHFAGTIGYRGVFNYTTVCMGLTIALCVIFMREKYVKLPKDIPVLQDFSVTEKEQTAQKKSAVSIWSEKAALPFALSHLLNMVANCSTMAFLVAYCNSIGITEISVYFVITSVSAVIIRLLLGKVADKRGTSIVLIPSFAFVILNYALLPFISSAPQLYALGIFSGAAGGMLTPVLQAILVQKCPGRSGNASALYYGATDAGIGIGGLLFGFIASAAGYRVMFFSAAVTVVFSLVTYLFTMLSSKKFSKAV
jgi:MFS family permease